MTSREDLPTGKGQEATALTITKQEYLTNYQ